MLSWNLCVFYFTCRCGKIRVVIRGYKGEHRRKSATVVLCALSSSPTFSSSKLTPAISHGLLTPTASCDSQPLPGTGPNKQSGSQQAITSCSLRTSLQLLQVLACSFARWLIMHDQGLRCALLCSPFRRQWV